MGLLDCVASPDERDKFDKTQRPLPRPRELSRSDHDISRRRALPLFSSQASLKNIRDVDFWRTRVLRFIFSSEGREDIRILRVPFKQLGYSAVTDFIAEIPPELFSEFLAETPPDEGILKEDKVFWVHDGIAEPGIFKWQGVIENVPIIGLQLDRKKAVPFGIHDGKGLYYCKPGHRALVPEQEVTPYKKFLRSFLGLPPRQDSLVGMRDSVRHSAKAIAAKNAKPGDKVYLPKEKTWATVQWIGKIEGETVVDLVYEPPKVEAGKPVSPDEPCVSRSMSLADFIGELASEPNTPSGISQYQDPKKPTKANSVPTTQAEPSSDSIPPDVPNSPIPESSNESYRSDEEDISSEDQDSETEEDSDSDQPMHSETDEESVFEEGQANNGKDFQDTEKIPDSASNENKVTEITEIDVEDSSKLPSPKRKGFFGFTQNKRQRRRKSPPPALTIEQKSEFASLPELKHTPATPRPRNSNIFGSWRFRNKQRKEPTPEKREDTSPPKPKERKSPVQPSSKKSGLSSSLGALFKIKSKTQLQKLALDETISPAECTTPIDEMVPPDKIPTPPPVQHSPLNESYSERRIDLPEYLNMPEKLNDQVDIPVSDSEKERGEVSLCPDDQSSESESDTEEEMGQGETKNVTVEMHEPPPRKKTSLDSRDRKFSEIKITTLEKEVVQEVTAQDTKEADQSPTTKDHEGSSLPYTPSSLERFKESRIRNRPTSFGSFLARMKNIKLTSDDVQQSAAEPVSPKPTLQDKDETKEDERVKNPETMTQEAQDRRNSASSQASHSGTDVSDGRESRKNSTGAVMEINKSLVKPQIGVQALVENEGNQEELVLELLDVKEQTPPVNSPPPLPAADPPKRRASRNRSFTFAFPGKRKPSQLQTPTSPLPKEELARRVSSDGMQSNDNRENVDPNVEASSIKTEDGENNRNQPKTSSFRNSFKRTFSLTRNKKRPSLEADPTSPISPPTPTNRISKPRPVTVYLDNNEVVQKRGSFKNKRPTSLVVDIKPWNARHGITGTDVYSSPSSDEAPMTPSSKSPNPALLPKDNETNIPKHRIFTTPAFFIKKQNTKKQDSEPLIPKTSKSPLYKKWNDKRSSHTSSSNENSPTNEQPPSSIEGHQEALSQVPTEESAAKLKSALKQRKEIPSIPKGLKVNDRVLWYSGKGPIPGTVQRLFKDGTDKYTAMVKFDREVQEEPLRLIREGDAYIVTVEELITPDMFEPTYANQSEIEKAKATVEPTTPVTPSVRFDGVSEEEPVPEVVITAEDTPEADDNTLPPPFQEEEVTMACGFQRGIQCRDKSCCLETILFSLFYTTNVFDITMLYANTANEDSMTQKVRNILRREIVDPLRREGFCPWTSIKKLRDAVKPLSDEWQTMSTDAEVMMFILFDRALKLQKFISYSNEMSDFLHQLVVDTKDFTKSTTVQHLFETSLKMMDKLKLKTIPTPALILEMPRSNDKLMQYKAVIPNLSLTISHILDGGPRLCICGAVAKYDCETCTASVGAMSIVYCDNCRSTADVIHFQLTHDAKLSPLSQPVIVLDLTAIICVKEGHYFSFVKCGQEMLSPWVFFDGVELENPKVCIEQNLSMWLDRLEKYPGRYQDALQYPLLTHILQDSHICIYQPREKSSSV